MSSSVLITFQRPHLQMHHFEGGVGFPRINFGAIQTFSPCHLFCISRIVCRVLCPYQVGSWKAASGLSLPVEPPELVACVSCPQALTDSQVSSFKEKMGTFRLGFLSSCRQPQAIIIQVFGLHLLVLLIEGHVPLFSAL